MILYPIRHGKQLFLVLQDFPWNCQHFEAFAFVSQAPTPQNAGITTEIPNRRIIASSAQYKMNKRPDPILDQVHADE
jgi:hypothetical protein